MRKSASEKKRKENLQNTFEEEGLSFFIRSDGVKLNSRTPVWQGSAGIFIFHFRNVVCVTGIRMQIECHMYLDTIGCPLCFQCKVDRSKHKNPPFSAASWGLLRIKTNQALIRCLIPQKARGMPFLKKITVSHEVGEGTFLR